jgi:hypothetical protein
METNYERLILENLTRFFEKLPPEPEQSLGAVRDGAGFDIRAFGEDCLIAPEGIRLGGKPGTGPRAVVVSLYALSARPDPVVLEPFQSFRELPNSAPYHGAFTANSEKVLVPHVTGIQQHQSHILQKFGSPERPVQGAGDFSLVLLPLPKIALQYIFYLPDEEFPASATCLFSANASSFLPLDGLADLAEYTAKEMIQTVVESR